MGAQLRPHRPGRGDNCNQKDEQEESGRQKRAFQPGSQHTYGHLRPQNWQTLERKKKKKHNGDVMSRRLSGSQSNVETEITGICNYLNSYDFAHLSIRDRHC